MNPETMSFFFNLNTSHPYDKLAYIEHREDPNGYDCQFISKNAVLKAPDSGIVSLHYYLTSPCVKMLEEYSLHWTEGAFFPRAVGSKLAFPCLTHSITSQCPQ